MNEIKNRLQGVFRKVLNNQKIELQPETTAKDIKEWDSLSHILLIVAIEREFKIKFKTAEIVCLMNVGEMLALLEKKLAPG